LKPGSSAGRNFFSGYWHDTTDYRLKLADEWTKVIASLIYLRYSKRRYLKFYLAFNRFLMKCFFHEALTFWEHAAGRCIIDNTSR
jgi:hypothetical protein